MRYSLVVPVFNDVAAIPELLERFFSVVDRRGDEVNVIIVDDGSPDSSWQQLKCIAGNYPGRYITLIRLTHNHGQQLAVLCGLRHMVGDAVVTIDADLQYSPEDISTLLDIMIKENLDLVYGVGMSGHNWRRRLLASNYHFWSGLFGVTFFQFSSFRVMKVGLARHLLDKIKTKTLSIDDRLFDLRPRQHAIDVRHNRRRHGMSGYTIWQLISSTLLCGFYSCRLLPAAILISVFLSLIAGCLYAIGGFIGMIYLAPMLLIFSLAFLISCSLIVLFRKSVQLEDFIAVREVFCLAGGGKS